MESWKIVDDFENYEVSSFGSVRNISTGKYLNGSPNKDDYLQVGLTKNGNVTKKLIHRLVAEAFIENPDGLEQVDHIDRDKSNNNIFNLRWITRSGNNFNRSSWGAGRTFEFVEEIPKPFVKITKYGKNIYDRLYYSGLTEKFYMLVDERAGFREIIPCLHGNYFEIHCNDIFNNNRTLGLTKLVKFANKRLEKVNLLPGLTDDDVICLLEDCYRSDILKEYNITSEQLDLELDRRNIEISKEITDFELEEFLFSDNYGTNILEAFNLFREKFHECSYKDFSCKLADFYN